MNVIIFKHFYFIDSIIFNNIDHRTFKSYLFNLYDYLEDLNNIDFIYLIDFSKIRFSDINLDDNKQINIYFFLNIYYFNILSLIWI